MPYESDPLALKMNDLVNDQELYFNLMDFESLSDPEKVLIGTWELVNEVYNGGFVQYFHNSSREHAKPMLDVLRLAGAGDAADILQSAITLAGPGTPSGDAPNYIAATGLIAGEVKSQIKDLQARFYDGLDQLHRQVFQFLASHRDQIDAPDEFWREASIQ